MSKGLIGILVFLLGSCPIWCATFEASLGRSCGHGGRCAGSTADPSAPSPVNDDDCVCNGALVTAGPGLSAWSGAEWFGTILLDLTPVAVPFPPAAVLAARGVPLSPGERCAPNLPELGGLRC